MSLSASGISIRFGGLVALNKVAVSGTPGELVGLVGPTGAGKTTLFNCLTGVAQPQEGRVQLEGQDISHLRLEHRVRLGIGRTFQTPRLDLAGSVADAVMLGFYPRLRQSILSACLPFSAARGLAVLLVEHNVGFVAELSHRMVALVGGEVVAEGKPADVVGDPQVVAAYRGVQRVAA